MGNSKSGALFDRSRVLGGEETDEAQGRKTTDQEISAPRAVCVNGWNRNTAETRVFSLGWAWSKRSPATLHSEEWLLRPSFCFAPQLQQRPAGSGETTWLTFPLSHRAPCSSPPPPRRPHSSRRPTRITCFAAAKASCHTVFRWENTAQPSLRSSASCCTAASPRAPPPSTAWHSPASVRMCSRLPLRGLLRRSICLTACAHGRIWHVRAQATRGHMGGTTRFSLPSLQPLAALSNLGLRSYAARAQRTCRAQRARP